jgi:putative pyruvate formate lyase activating enzyme
MSLYVELFNKGELAKRVEIAKALLHKCQLCPNECNADRVNGECGRCQTHNLAAISSYGPHFGEEAPLVGTKGSGTIFLKVQGQSSLRTAIYHVSIAKITP